MFTCDEPKNDVLARILFYCIGMQMMQQCVNETRNKEHRTSAKQKLFRLCKN